MGNIQSEKKERTMKRRKEFLIGLKIFQWIGISLFDKKADVLFLRFYHINYKKRFSKYYVSKCQA